MHRQALARERPLLHEALDWQLVLANVDPPLSVVELTRGAEVFNVLDKNSSGCIDMNAIYDWVDAARGQQYRDSGILFDVLVASVATEVPGQWKAEEFLVLAHRIAIATQPELDEAVFVLMATERTASGEPVRAACSSALLLPQ